MAAKFTSPSSSNVVTTVSTIMESSRGGATRRPRWSRFEDPVEVQWVLAELAAVVPGADLHNPRAARGPDAHAHRGFHRADVEAVDDDLVDGPDTRRQAAHAQVPERGAVLLVGRRPERLVARADLAAA